MDWRGWFRKAGLPGLIVIFIITIVILYWIPYFVNSASGSMSVISAGVLKPLAYFQVLALEKNPPWWAPPLFLLTGLLFMFGFPLVTFTWLLQLTVKRKKDSPNSSVLPESSPKGFYRNTRYEADLAKLVQAVNKLRADEEVPENLRRALVKLIRLFETSIMEIIGIENRAHCRMMWIVRSDNPQEFPTIWARKQDGDLHENEERVVNTCFTLSWFTALEKIKKNPLFEKHIPEKMETLICARNLDSWKIGFVLAIDKPFFLSNEIKMSLLAHMAFLMPLWDMDMMRKVMLDLQGQDWKEGDVL